MGIYKIEKNDMDKISPLFKGMYVPMVLSCLQGHMGCAFADSPLKPQSAQIILKDFCFFMGKPNIELIKNHPGGLLIMIPGTPQWGDAIDGAYGVRAEAVTRYATKPSPRFDIPMLKAYAACLCDDFSLHPIERSLYNAAKSSPWSHDLCSGFSSYSHYAKNGLGFMVLHGAEPVAGASSYAFYDGGIEIEIDTRVDHRHRGLATACASALILKCLRRGLYPSWDAQNTWSPALAEKLGYEPAGKYSAYKTVI